MPKRKYATAIVSRWQSAKRRRKASRATAVIPVVRRAKYTTMARQRVNLGAGPIPKSSIVVLRYVHQWKSDGVATYLRFNLNSTYSPAYAGGHQPLGRDQLAALYNRYRVWSVKCNLQVALDDSKDKIPILVTLVPANSGSAYTNVTEAAEQQQAYHRTSGVGGPPLNFSKRYSLPRVVGQSRQGYKDDRYSALVSATPAEAVILHIYYQNCYNNSTLSDAYASFTLTMDMKCEFYDPNPLGQS